VMITWPSLLVIPIPKTLPFLSLITTFLPFRGFPSLFVRVAINLSPFFFNVSLVGIFLLVLVVLKVPELTNPSWVEFPAKDTDTL
jgi:hypothetical protein